jgi:hypothetical protein
MATRPRPRGRHLGYVVPVVALFVTVFLTVACSDEGSAERAAAEAAIQLELSSQGYVTFHNRSGLPLSDVSIALVPYGPGEFTKLLPRVENTGRRQVALSEFRARDGTPFNPRVARGKVLRVRAQDSTGKSYETEIPFK